MMKKVLLAVIVVFVAIVAIPQMASAGCTIYDYGILFDDFDCDGVIDFNSSLVQVDNCIYVRNGDCDADPEDCDVDLSGGTPTTRELMAGNQADWDGNGVGDACDDYDGDTILDYLDTCRSVYNFNQDPIYCTDTDGDLFEDPIDNCVLDYNPDQIDSDLDGFGDACDNCRHIYNPAQTEIDCPQEDGSAGNGQVQYGVGTPQAQDGYNTEYGQGTIKGNGVSNSCSLVHASPALPSLSMSLILLALGVARRRR